MTTWLSENDVYSFLNVVPPCGRGNSLKVLEYLQQKGISSPSCSSSVASSCSGSDDEDAVFPPVARNPGTGVGRGTLMKNINRDAFMGFNGERERWDDAVHSQLRRANKQSYTTDAFELQLKLLHKAQEEREKMGQFEEASSDEASSTGNSASCAESTSPSPDCSSSMPTNSLERDPVRKAEEVRAAEGVDERPKPVYKSVRSRNVLLNSLEKMTVADTRVLDEVEGTGVDVQACSSSVATSDDSASASPLIFDSAASSPLPDQFDQNDAIDYITGFSQEDNFYPLTRDDVSNDKLFPNYTYNSIPFSRKDLKPNSGSPLKNNIDYPSVVGQYYDNPPTNVNSNDDGYVFRKSPKPSKFSPPSLVGLENLGYSHSVLSQYNIEFELKPEEFPPLQ